MRQLPEDAAHSACKATLREKSVNIGAKVVTHSRYVVFQMAEVAVARELFDTILRCV